MDSENKSSDLHHDLRDASFSYLTKAQQNFVGKLTESSQVQLPHPELSFTQQTSVLPVNSDKPKPEEGEISVFGAEKYFNMKIEEDQTPGSYEPNANNFMHEHTEEHRSGELHRMKSKSRFGTPSVSSESSWNSQIALLPIPRRNLSHNRQKRVNERWYFPGFACKGSCSDDKSVYTDPNVARLQITRNPIMLDSRKQSQSRILAKDEQFRSASFGKTSQVGSKRHEYLVLPTVNSGVQNLQVQTQQKPKTLDEDPRKSIEVFGSHTIKKEDIASNLERKLSVLTWDAIPFPKAESLPTNSASSQIIYEDGNQSDASSDLFEIENISCSPQPIFTKQTSDGMSGFITPYAPSETSIEWSVVTASAADFSAFSDFDEKKPAEISTNSPGLLSTPRLRRPNSLLGCKSQKAVDVAEAAYKKTEKSKLNYMQNHHRRSLDNSMQVRGDSKVKNYEFP